MRAGDILAEVKVVRTSDCEPGMVLASDIVNDYGAVVLYQNSKLDEYSIDKLIKLGINVVRVYKNYEFKEKKQIVINAQYNNNLEEFKQVVWDISCGKGIDMDKLEEITTNMHSNFDSVNDLIVCLSKVRSISEYTYTHSLNVSMLSSLLGNWLNLDDTLIKELTYCGLLHDIGKCKIPAEILNKPDSLTLKEFEEVKKHPVTGYKMLENAEGISKDIALGVLMHHEREDGSGYPFNLTSNQINYYAKVISVVDIYDAMTSNRAYKKRQSPFDVLEMYESEYLIKCDAGIMLTFLKHIASYYVGNKVKLNNNALGEIVYINPNRISRPLVKTNTEILDLSRRSDLKIVEML